MADQNYVGVDEEQQPLRVKTKEETDKKCPACGGVMDFDPATGGLLCPYCGHTQEIETEEGLGEQDFASAEITGNCNWGAEKKVVICQSCGAESVYDALDVSNECPYCGSNQVMEEKGKDTLAPGGVCPFKIDKKKAGANFKSWIKGKLFCPSLAKEKAKPDSFKGVYLPYWTFDTQTQSTYEGQYGIDRTEKTSDGKTRIVTDWYYTSGDYREFIDDQLVIGTTRHDSAMLSSIEPFDTANNVAYKPEYLSGFIAERYSVGLNDGWEKDQDDIRRHLENQISDKIRCEHNADRVSSLRVRSAFDDVKYKYLMLPIWLSSFKYNGKVYNFMVNGQTGRVGGKTPISPWRVAAAVLIGVAIVGAIWYFNQQGAPVHP